MHATANIVAFALLDNAPVSFNSELLLYIAPSIVVLSLIRAGLGWWLLRRQAAASGSSGDIRTRVTASSET